MNSFAIAEHDLKVIGFQIVWLSRHSVRTVFHAPLDTLEDRARISPGPVEVHSDFDAGLIEID